MKIKSLRGHYRRQGRSWIPKRKFASEEEIISSGEHPDNWKSYICDECNFLHVADLDKLKDKADDNI